MRTLTYVNLLTSTSLFKVILSNNLILDNNQWSPRFGYIRRWSKIAFSGGKVHIDLKNSMFGHHKTHNLERVHANLALYRQKLSNKDPFTDDLIWIQTYTYSIILGWSWLESSTTSSGKPLHCGQRNASLLTVTNSLQLWQNRSTFSVIIFPIQVYVCPVVLSTDVDIRQV